MSGSPEFNRKINRLIRVKVQEIIDGCLRCQGKVLDRDGTQGCTEHSQLISDMIIHPRKYAAELLEPGDGKKKEGV